jgi:hypothetical protein
MTQSAVLITGYNRPDLLENLLKTLQNYDGKLYVSLDFPKDYQKDGAAFQENKIICRRYSNIISECQIFDVNQGCFQGVTKAISWAFEKEDKLIIFEDDIRFDEAFLRFANEALIQLEGNNSIGSISGLNLVPKLSQSFPTESTRLSVFTATWGWATWRNRWVDYIDDLGTFPKLDWGWASQSWSQSEKYYWKKVFQSVADGNVDSYGYRWLYSNWKRRRWTLTPNENLTLNLGFGPQATHTRDEDHPWWLPTDISSGFMFKELVQDIKFDVNADKWVSKNHFRTNWVYQLRAHIGLKFPKISKFAKIFLRLQ